MPPSSSAVLRCALASGNARVDAGLITNRETPRLGAEETAVDTQTVTIDPDSARLIGMGRLSVKALFPNCVSAKRTKKPPINTI
jgi:hypothetical protein